MAEGLYGLLHRRAGADHATIDYWRAFLNSRKRFLEGVLVRSQRVEPLRRERIACSIKAALSWSRQIEPRMCTHYISLWRRDLITWEQRLKEAPTLHSAHAALRELDLEPFGPGLDAPAGITGASGRQKGDWPTRDGIRRIGGLVRRTEVSRERFEPAAAYWNPDYPPLIAGRHRGAPKPALAFLSSRADDAYRQQVDLTELSQVWRIGR